MKSFLNLKVIVFLLLVLILNEVVGVFFLFENMQLDHSIRFISLLIQLYSLLFLFLYVTRVKKQKVSMVAFAFLILICLYQLVNTYIPIAAGQSKYITLANGTYRIGSITEFFSIIAHVFIAIQLIKNTCEGISNQNLKLVGYSFLLLISMIWLVPFVGLLNINIYMLLVIYKIPTIALIYFYYNEMNLEEQRE